jgi:hypothetical protein
MLEEVREHFSNVPDTTIVDALSAVNNGKEAPLIDAIYDAHESESMAYRDAIAHVLLERNILCGIADMTGELYVDQRPCPRSS